MASYGIASKIDISSLASNALYDIANVDNTFSSLESIPPAKQPKIYIALYSNVRNSAEIRQRLIAQDAKVDFALVDARTTVSISQIQTAAFQAIMHSRATKSPNNFDVKLKTHNINSEILYCLNPSTNISEALRRFGINDDTTSIVAVKVVDQESSCSIEEMEDHFESIIDGIQESLSKMTQFTDFQRVKKIYKIPANLKEKDYADDIINTIAVKDIL